MGNAMYDRLLSIFNGDDITPEDYDLLLQLDTNNAKKTMDEKAISEIPIILVEQDEEDIHEENDINCMISSVRSNAPTKNSASSITRFSNDTCKICLEKFHNLPK